MGRGGEASAKEPLFIRMKAGFCLLLSPPPPLSLSLSLHSRRWYCSKRSIGERGEEEAAVLLLLAMHCGGDRKGGFGVHLSWKSFFSPPQFVGRLAGGEGGIYQDLRLDRKKNNSGTFFGRRKRQKNFFLGGARRRKKGIFFRDCCQFLSPSLSLETSYAFLPILLSPSYKIDVSSGTVERRMLSQRPFVECNFFLLLLCYWPLRELRNSLNICVAQKAKKLSKILALSLSYNLLSLPFFVQFPGRSFFFLFFPLLLSSLTSNSVGCLWSKKRGGRRKRRKWKKQDVEGHETQVCKSIPHHTRV